MDPPTYPFEETSFMNGPLLLRRLKVAILKFSLMYLINNVHVATSGIQLLIPLKPAASSNLFIYRLEEVAGFRNLLSRCCQPKIFSYFNCTILDTDAHTSRTHSYSAKSKGRTAMAEGTTQ